MSEEVKENPATEPDSPTIEHVHHSHYLAIDVTPRFQQFFVVWFLSVALLIVLKKGFRS